MAVPASTTQTVAAIGIREQLSDTIMNITPTDTPFVSAIKKTSISSVTPEWLRDRYRKPSATNAVVEGNDVSNLATGQPDRLKNHAQLFDGTVQVTSTTQAVRTAGRANELKYQVLKEGHALRLDIEMRACGNYTSVARTASVAGEMAGFEAWMVTNVDRGATGASAGYNSGTGITTKATDGTARAFTEALLKGVIQKAWNNGGDIQLILMPGTVKQKFSSFTGVVPAQQLVQASDKVTTLGAVDYYKSDFGKHRAVASRFLGAGTGRTANATTGYYDGPSASGSVRAALLVDPKTWKLAFLQPFKTVPLAKLGHSDRRMLFAELTLECLEERGNGVVADLQD